MTMFQDKAPGIARALMNEFGLDELSASAILGNLGHESGGFKFLQEMKPTIRGSAGGWGFAQWTGPRRRAFDAWTAAKGLDPSSDEANLGFLIHELHTTEAKAIPAVQRAVGLEAKVRAFEAAFERSGVKHYPSRYAYAAIAYTALTGQPITVEAPMSPKRPKAPPTPSNRTFSEDGLPAFEIKAIQEALVALGYQIVGVPDGIWGDRTTAAVKALQTQAARRDSGVITDGHYGPQTKALLSDPANKAPISEARGNTTADDLARIKNPGVTKGRAIKWVSIFGMATALLTAAYQAWQTPADLPLGSSILIAFLPPPFAQIISTLGPFLIAFLPMAYTAIAGDGLISTSVKRFRQGIDNTGLPPAPEDDDVRGDLFGRMFGRRS